MAKIREMFQVANESAATVSTIVRTLNFSLIAVIWILSHESLSELPRFSLSIACILLSQLFDLLQYIWKSLSIHVVAHKLEDKTPREDRPTKEFDYPKFIYRVTNLFFYLKVILTFAAALYLLNFFLCQSCQS